MSSGVGGGICVIQLSTKWTACIAWCNGARIMSTGHEQQSDKDAELTREIRAGRKFSLSEAIGRLAGPGMMKGVSPVARKQQVEVEIEHYLERVLADAGGALGHVIIRNIRQSEQLLKNYDHPLAVLATYVQTVLDSEALLKDFVREADVEWAKIMGERPVFEQEGAAPQPADPYTLESVRTGLSRFMTKLTEDIAKTTPP